MIHNYYIKKMTDIPKSFHATDVSRKKYLVKLEDNMSFLYDESSDEIDN